MKEPKPKLPSLLSGKIHKTGQTRGADDDAIFQNRVSRSSTVLIPYSEWHIEYANLNFEEGYIVLVPPKFIDKRDELAANGIRLGENGLLFYETRADWVAFNPEAKNLQPANSRTAPLGGEYVARVPATTAKEGSDVIRRGFSTKKPKGAGIRFYEYADKETISLTRLQLEAIFWLCEDSIQATVNAGMKEDAAKRCKEASLQKCEAKGLLEYDRLRSMRILDNQNFTVCPLCLQRLHGADFMKRMSQMQGREVPDLTVTEVSLFHIHELRPGEFNHKPYNLGWGHHHCNVVVKDSGIAPTLQWMISVIERNKKAGFIN